MQRATAYAEALAPVAGCMIEEARIAPGQRVLDVGSGGGDMALLAAEAAGPSGFVLATDAVLANMAGLATRIDAMTRPPSIAIREAPAEELALEPGTFDVALARNCVMYFGDLGRALAGIRRALRPDGRLVISLYGPLEREPFHAIPIKAVTSRHMPPEPAPDYVRAFSISAEDLRSALAKAGYTGLRTRTIAVRRTYADLAAALVEMRQSQSLGEMMAILPAALREDAWADIEQGFRRFAGSSHLVVPGEQVVVTGTA
jgi:ubiquinone/menaquinone biosynthesis C-methylase UbiE